MPNPNWIASMDDRADAIIAMERRLAPLRRQTGFHAGDFYEFISITTGDEHARVYRRWYIQRISTGECQYAENERDFSQSVALFVDQESLAANATGG